LISLSLSFFAYFLKKDSQFITRLSGQKKAFFNESFLLVNKNRGQEQINSPKGQFYSSFIS